MEDEKKTNGEDISKNILETSPKTEKAVTKEIAEKEEKIAKNISEKPKDDLEERKKKAMHFLKKKKDWMVYLILAFITYIAIYIRILNIPKLKDVTTGTWTLGPDLDPFLFLRWAKYIVAHGSLMAVDMMRYSPIGYNTANESKLLSYMIVGLQDIITFFSKEATITYAAIIFPVIMFALTTIAFFLFARKLFYKEDKSLRNTIALIATTFFVLIPSLLPRTIAGIPEKESAAFFFMFMAFYFFLEAFTSDKLKKGVIFGILAGAFTGLMALVWGGVIFIFFTISPAVLLAFLLGKVKKKEFLIYSLWLITSFIVMMPNLKSGIILQLFSDNGYGVGNLIDSTSTGLAIAVFFLIGLSMLIMKIKNQKLLEIQKKIKLPKEFFALIISTLILLIIALIIFGPSFFTHKLVDIKSSMISPQTSRWGLTVAENKQPYFLDDWKESFGPIVLNIPLFFWMFFIGAVALFSNLIKNFEKKDKIILTISYTIFLFCLIFSRYSSSSILDGISGLSILMYIGGVIILFVAFAYFYYLNYKKQNFSAFKEINFAYIIYFFIMTVGIVGARGAVRLIMLLGVISPVAISFLIVKTAKKTIEEKDELKKFIIGIMALVLIIASLYTMWVYYQTDKVSAENFAPGPYQWQWQEAMSWVRENTSETSVFGHWWDYGYWVQSLGERATILDGSNSIVYWNYMMGRYVLTGTDEREALEFLYAHNGTHILIDSSDLGKYTAFSSIGSDENYDRYSWITSLLMDEKQTQETKNETIYIYVGGSVLDEDIIWNQSGTNILLPGRRAGLGAIILKKPQNISTFDQPEGVFVYNGNQYIIPLRYAYFNGELYDFGSGLDAGIFIFQSLSQDSNGKVNINEIGALMYLSRRTIHSNLVNFYLFDKDSDYIKLAHTESNAIVNNLRTQGFNSGEFVYYQGVQGPIKIWEIKYPSDIKLNSSYLEKEFPNINLFLAKPGEY